MKKQFNKLALCLAVLFAFVTTITGCGGGIEGTWVLVEEIEADGNKLSKKDLEELGVNETSVIEGDVVKYTCDVELLNKPVEIEFELEELGNNEYNFNLSDSITFASPTIKGNKMTYTVGEGDSQSTMIFKRQ